MFDWNDLKYFLAVAGNGSTVAAGKALGVSQSTVHRRISALESRLGQPLVVRQPQGYGLTHFGETFLHHAKRVEAAIEEMEQHLGGAERDRSGVIRMTCPEPIVHRISPVIDRFHARYPKLRVQFVMSDRYLDLLRGEADVALRSGDTDAELVGRKLADSVWAVYASRDYVARHGAPQGVHELGAHKLVGLDASLGNHRVFAWLQTVAPEAKLVARNNSVLGLLRAIKSGLGVGPLPTAIADEDSDLVRVLGPVPELARSWRLLTHPELRRTPRIAAFFDFMITERDALKTALTG